MDDPRIEFLNLLFALKPAASFLLIWELATKLSYWCQTVEQALEIVQPDSVNLYAAPGLSAINRGPHHRCPSAETIGILALVLDLDLAGAAHSNKLLPPTVQGAEKVLPPDLEPTMLIHSGHGLQAWWFFKEAWIFDNPQDRERAAGLARRLFRMAHNRAARHGWTVDNTSDLARVMRIPGTINRKDGLEDTPATILRASGIHYNPSELAEYLSVVEDLPETVDVPNPDAVGPFHVNPKAEIAPRFLEGLSRYNVLFRETWAGRRDDLTDQSQSSYDMALGNILCSAGATDQEIVDGLVHHRRMRNQKSKTARPEWYRDTLARIHHRPWQTQEDVKKIAATRAALDKLVADGNEEPKEREKKEESEEARLVRTAVEQASEVKSIHIPKEPGDCLLKLNEILRLEIQRTPVRIGRIVWVRSTTKSRWRIELCNGEIITLTDSSQYDQWKYLKHEIQNQINGTIWPGSVRLWPKGGVTLFQQALIPEGSGGEDDIRGEMREVLTAYLSHAGVHPPDVVWSGSHQYELPLLYKDRIAIFAADLVDWLWRKRNERHEKSEITFGLSSIGAARIQVKIQGSNTTQSRYLLGEEWRPEEFSEIERKGRMGLRKTAWMN